MTAFTRYTAPLLAAVLLLFGACSQDHTPAEGTDIIPELTLTFKGKNDAAPRSIKLEGFVSRLGDDGGLSLFGASKNLKAALILDLRGFSRNAGVQTFSFDTSDASPNTLALWPNLPDEQLAEIQKLAEEGKFNQISLDPDDYEGADLVYVAQGGSITISLSDETQTGRVSGAFSAPTLLLPDVDTQYNITGGQITQVRVTK